MRLVQLVLLLSLLAVSFCGMNQFQRDQLEQEMQTRREKHQNRVPTWGADQTITVHLIPHTHDDVGWLKTVDYYFVRPPCLPPLLPSPTHPATAERTQIFIIKK